MHDHYYPSHNHSQHQVAAGQLKDPVCGMSVDPQSAQHHHRHDDQTYFFCSAHCLHKFRDDPAAYVGEAGASQEEAGKAAAGDDAVYTCPMHPEVEQIGPGTCPKCGMALEPKQVSAEEGP